MIIKHFIITRFLNDDKMRLGRTVLDKNVIENGIKLYKRYLYPSLSSQSNKNFTHIIIIHDEVNRVYLEELDRLIEQANFKTIILTNSYYESYMREQFVDCDYFITSRVDYDDAFYYNAVADIQESVNSNPISIYTWRKGVLTKAMSDEYYDYKYIPENKNKIAGCVSIMLSLIINCKKIHRYSNIYEYNHAEICRTLAKTIDYDFLIINERRDPCWISVKHDFNDSSVGKVSHKDKALQNSVKIKFDINKFYNT